MRDILNVESLWITQNLLRKGPSMGTTVTPETDETKRDRVRRLLIDPLTEAGFRFPKATGEDEAKRALTRLADGLAYLGDDALTVLKATLLTKGEGSARCFWPTYVTIVGLAEAYQPRPLEEVPELLRWFASAAGRDAMAAGRLVAEFQFWEAKKRPPVTPRDRELVTVRAREHRERRELVLDRRRRDIPLRADEVAWIDWYERTFARVEALVGEVAA